MNRFISRRRAIAELSSLALLPALSTQVRSEQLPVNKVFAHGVASGDPDHNSLIIWSRVSDVSGRVTVKWELSDSSDFNRIVAKGKVRTGPERDYTVKQLVDGLEPGKVYYYRFNLKRNVSMVGRTRTLPVGHVEKLGLAVVSCSNYPFGFFNAYDAIAKDQSIDLVLHLGDYIYEYAEDSWGGGVGAQIGRLHLPKNEIVSLYDYRQRHAQYKTDVGSLNMHAAHPLIAIWDDHESTNNPWMDGAENHQPDSEGAWSERRAASLQAYYEWMPIREPKQGASRQEYWRNFEFGDLACLVSLETRHTGRSLQIDYAEHMGSISSSEDRDRFMREVLGDQERTMLSENMEQFLAESLKQSVDSQQRWRIIANQIPMARTHVPPMNHPFFQNLKFDDTDPVAAEWQAVLTQAEFDLPIYLDTWDGYQAAREKFYTLCKNSGANDLLVLTGDSHAFWQNQLFDAGGKPMGLELGTTGVTSPGDFLRFGEEGANVLDNLIANHNDEIVWTENRFNGYVRLVLNKERALADFVRVSTVLKPEYELETVHQCRIENVGGNLRYS